MLNIYKINQIGISILILGYINIYTIYNKINCIINEISLKINENNLMVIILLISLIYIIHNIFYYPINMNLFDKKYELIEFQLLFSFLIISINILLFSSDYILFFICLEFYSLALYLLIYSPTKNIKYLNIYILIYFILSTISSTLILLGIVLLYGELGNLNIEILNIIYYYNILYNINLNLPYLLIFIGLIFKLGSAPFQFIIIRLYSTLNPLILLFISIIPKIIITYIFINIFYNYIIIQFPYFINLLLIFSILSLIIGSIGGLYYNQFNIIMGYSSITTIGYILILISSYMLSNTNKNIMGEINSIYDINNSLYNNIFIFLIIYSINILLLFSSYILFYNNNNNFFFFIKDYPTLGYSFLIAIFSLIGIPPLGGFFAKLILIINCFNTSNKVFYYLIILILLSSIISACIYLKFINFIYFNDNKNNNILNINIINLSYFIGFFTIIILFYPLYLSFLTDIFESLFLI